MARSASRPRGTRSRWILPLVLLTVALLEELGWSALRRHIPSVPMRVAVRLVLVGVAFTVAAEVIEPWLRALYASLHTHSRRNGGSFGPWLFYALAYGLLYVAYYVLETRGPRALLP